MFVVYVCYPASCPGVPGSTRVGMLRDLRRTRRMCAVYRISNAKLRAFINYFFRLCKCNSNISPPLFTGNVSYKLFKAEELLNI